MEESKARLMNRGAAEKPPQNSSDFEEGQVSEDDDEIDGGELTREYSQNYRFVARLPPYCRVNPNMPLTKLNTQMAIVQGIDRRS